MEKNGVNNLHFQITGKLIDVERINTSSGTLYKNIIVAPAENEFSYPNQVALMSTRSVGEINAVVTAKGKIQGRVNRRVDDNGNRKAFHNHELWEAM